MSLVILKSIDPATYDLLSVDVFDTLLLRDASIQRLRFRDVARIVSKALAAAGQDIDTDCLLKMRRMVHHTTYQAVSLERPAGDASLSQMIDIQLSLLRLGKAWAHVFHDAELEVERRRLGPNRPLIRHLETMRQAGKRIIAVSDNYLSKNDIASLFDTLLGRSPVDEIYVSCELGLTKHAGGIFAEIAKLENTPANRILHCGDNLEADVLKPQEAGCQGVLLPPAASMRMVRNLAAIPVVLTS